MGSGASSFSTLSYDIGQSNADQQQPKLLKVTLEPPMPASAAAKIGTTASPLEFADDEGPPPLLDSRVPDPDAIHRSAWDASEAMRQSIMLPTTPAQHVGRLWVGNPAGTTDSTGTVTWLVPKSALQPLPQHGSSATTPSTAPSGPLALLSPTFMIPCDVDGPFSATGVLSADKGSGRSTTEWQLVLEHQLPASGAAAPDITTPTSSLRSAPNSPLSTPRHFDSPDTPTAGFSHATVNPAAQLPLSPAAARQGQPGVLFSTQGSSTVGSDRVQVWRPSIRFMGLPSCSTAQHSAAAAGPTAAAAAAGSDSASTSGSGQTATCTAGKGSTEVHIPAHIAASSDTVGSTTNNNSTAHCSSSSSSSGSGSGSGSGCGGAQQVERRLLSSSWSIRKKNLAPASYRAAQQAEYTAALQTQHTAAVTSLAVSTAEHAHAATGMQQQSAASDGQSTGQGMEGSAAGQVSSSRGGSAWQVQCRGQLSITTSSGASGGQGGGMKDATEQASGSSSTVQGFDVQVDKLGGAWGCPSCDISSSSVNADATTEEVGIQVDFSQVKLLLLVSSAYSTGPQASPAALSSNSSSTSAAAASTADISSKAHQQHPLGLSPPHTPTKSTSGSASSSSTNSSRSDDTTNQPAATAGSGPSAAAVLPPRTPTAAPAAAAAAAVAPSSTSRQLEAVLLSHSPRMLVIDNFFTPELCTGLMDLARDKLVRSRVASGSETPSRTSSGHFFVKDAARHPLILEAEALIEALFNSSAVRGGYGPLAKVEAMQVVRYYKGEFYHEHYDNRADGPLTRSATILVYLCDTQEGGATSFSRAVTGFGKSPEADALVLPPQVSVGAGGRGVKIFPVQGRALIFWSKRPNGDEDPNSIHAADTVLAGEKWIATRWMKDNF